MSGEARLSAALLSRVPALQDELAACETRVVALRLVLDGIQRFEHGSEGVVATPLNFQGQQFIVGRPTAYGPRGTESFLGLLKEEPTRLWKLIDIKRELLGRGWAPSPKAVDASARRLLDQGLVLNPRYGWYALPGYDEEPA